MEKPAQRRAARGDALIAAAFALVLGGAWAARDWGALSALHLPDTDDALRLQQIRDWLGGQAFGDVRQYRLAGGLAMHWSRLPDLVPAAMIAALRPMVGAQTAEVATAIAWPILLFGAALALIASITRTLAPAAARTAIIVGGIAYPVTTLFAPGRIDHHGMQMVLLLVAVRALIAAPSGASGAVAGIAMAASLIVGMELAPVLSLAALSVWLRWWWGSEGTGGQLAGLGIGLGAGIAVGAAGFATTDWTYLACDSFTRTVWTVAQTGAVIPLVLGLASPWLPRRWHRLAASIIIGAAMAAMIAPGLRECVAPYGRVDPLVTRLWLHHVGEAQSLLAAPVATGLAYAGLLIAGIIASGWRVVATRAPGWALILALQVGALAVACFELRGVYAGVTLSAPALAVAIGAARKRGPLWLAGAWIGSAGMLYPIAAQALAPPARPVPGCDIGAALEQIGPATVMTSIDIGARALSQTHHRLIAAPYHRNNAGNGAMYRFFLGSPEAARAIAMRWRVDLVLLCPGDFAELTPAERPAASGLLPRLRRGTAPDWLIPVPVRGGARLWRVAGRLPPVGLAD
ncbi:MAG: hypothetical protein H2054_09610 [Sphingomonas sp.]|uniref:hypothetical protein n=1 Tax=Sphingomonas sp. TaxID=28214 RepID=UPI0018487EB2|nr:hypothetical protein [Sphingomonas sp.]